MQLRRMLQQQLDEDTGSAYNEVVLSTRNPSWAPEVRPLRGRTRGPHARSPPGLAPSGIELETVGALQGLRHPGSHPRPRDCILLVA
eukprot:269355-Prymnesium_polylepis.1